MSKKPLNRPHKDSSWLADSNIDTWYVYRKDLPDSLNDMMGDETYLFKHGDIYHVIGELLDTLRDMRRDRQYTFHEKSLQFQSLQIRPYCFTVWGRLITNIDIYKLYYIVVMNPDNADIIIYSCWSIKGKDDRYKLYKWRGELPNKHGDLRKYKRTANNLLGEYHIPPCWPTISSIQLVRRGTKQTSYIRKPIHGQSGRITEDNR